MLRHSFLHLPGIGEQTEQKLWDQGVRTWDTLAECVHELFGAKKASAVACGIEESQAALEAGEYRFFSQRLKGAHAWRLVPDCGEQAAYLDIETTGLGFPPASHSTTIAISFGGELFVEHDHKKKLLLLEKMNEEASMVVTFNGACFDLPFLRQEYDLPLDLPHVDLRMWLRRLGYTGGLKAIQSSLSEIPQRSSMDIDGFDAVRLWRMHKQGVPKALETLMTYNAEDAICLEPLLQFSIECEQRRHESLVIKGPAKKSLPPIPTEVDDYVYSLLRGQETWQVPRGW